MFACGEDTHSLRQKRELFDLRSGYANQQHLLFASAWTGSGTSATITKNRPQGSNWSVKSTWCEVIRKLGFRLWRRYPLATSEERALRSTLGVCEPAALAVCKCLNRKWNFRNHNKKPTTRVGFLLWWGKLDSDQRSQ